MLYRILLFAHVLGAILWLGGGVMFQLLAERANASDDASHVATLMEDADRLGTRFFMPVSIVVLAAGLWMVFQGDWGFDEPFVLGGLLGYVASAVLGGAVTGPLSKKVAAGLRERGSLEPDLRAQLDRLKGVGRIDLAILTAVVFLMTVKPGT